MKVRKKLIAGNWKMNKTLNESIELVEGILKKIKDYDDREILFCPPFTSLYKISEIIKGKKVKLGGQNLYFEEKGAYTGEISGKMLKSVGCDYVILGHSERRSYFNESDEFIQKKIIRAMLDGLIPILCVGEKLEEREKGIMKDTVSKQVRTCLNNVPLKNANELVIAYEPVWAIGTGRNATPEQAEEVHIYIRELIGQMYGNIIKDSLRILYGGSVNAGNAKELLSQKNIDGALVGGASLKVDEFVTIIESV
jgi:triosephosphate isomerase